MSSGPHHQVPLTPAQMQQQHAQNAMQLEMAKRRSRKPTDKNLPDGIDECIVGDTALRYRELRDFEQRIDATMTRKRLDIVDAVTRSVKVCQETNPACPVRVANSESYSGLRRSGYGSPTQLKIRSGKAMVSTWIHSISAQTWSLPTV